MMISELDVPGLGRPALLRLPEGPVRAGVVALHPAAYGERDQVLFEHLAETLTPLGYAVASYDRRAKVDGDDVPFEAQADDALVAVDWLAGRLGVPVGLWGFSQGTWAAAVAAARTDRVAFLALLGCPGVTPAMQMRYYTDEALRRNGYDDEDRAELTALRSALEGLLRGDLGRERAEELLAEYNQRPWFQHAYLPPEVPEDIPAWTDMDFDPAPGYAQVTCPVLLVYGADEECVPIAPSVAAWRTSGNPRLDVVEIPGVGHWPGPGPEHTRENLSPDYTRAIVDWFAAPRW
ncbi:alpha/beta fold hydrolase [Longispora sp. K20-0274]|uniref:alpha/beta hydrolase family protein n=1 Tax=Longispora sp. K20-0274 TaxID=3088255 RepID=UPI00399B47FB